MTEQNHSQKFHIHAELVESDSHKPQTLEKLLSPLGFYPARFDNQVDSLKDKGFRHYTQGEHLTYKTNSPSEFLRRFRETQNIFQKYGQAGYVEGENIIDRVVKLPNIDIQQKITKPGFEIIQRTMQSLEEFDSFQIHISTIMDQTSPEFIEMMHKTGFYITAIPKPNETTVVFTSQTSSKAKINQLKTLTEKYLNESTGWESKAIIKIERVAKSYIQNMKPSDLPPVFNEIKYK
jgi:hypothetical protein